MCILRFFEHQNNGDDVFAKIEKMNVANAVGKAVYLFIFNQNGFDTPLLTDQHLRMCFELERSTHSIGSEMKHKDS